MKHFFTTLVLLALMSSCDSSRKTVEATPTPQVAETIEPKAPVKPAPPAVVVKPAPKLKTMLVGKEDRSALKQAPFDSWFNPNYAKYVVNTDYINDIEKGLEGVTITTFMGTWCGDSKRETPRMFKILDDASFKNQDLELITVDRTKKKPTMYTEGNNIIRVPTFIFKKDGKEIGRIVERPVESLEEDMLKILNGEPYKHSYEN